MNGETRTLNFSGLQDCVTVQTNGLLAIGSIVRAEQSYQPTVVSIAVIRCSSGICFYWKMTKEVPGITLGIEIL
jgi:hypothetical protein